MKRTQKDIVKGKLIADREVTNLWAIEHYILRLGAVINQIRADGWDIEGDYIPGTKNWQYRLKSANQFRSVFEHIKSPDGKTMVVRETRVPI